MTLILSRYIIYEGAYQVLHLCAPMSSSDTMNPALPPPHGQSPNFANPESLSKWNTLCVSVCLSITTIAFSLRTYVRIAIKREWVVEDCKSLVSLRVLALTDVFVALVCISWVSRASYSSQLSHGRYINWVLDWPGHILCFDDTYHAQAWWNS